jgi:hypothetical protein
MSIRELAEKRIESLEGLAGKSVKTTDIEHMLVGSEYVDLSKANNWMEVAAAERISKEPRRQSKDENDQLLTLQVTFPEVAKPKEKLYWKDIYEN